MVSAIGFGMNNGSVVVSNHYGFAKVRYSILALDDKNDVSEYLVDDQTDRSMDPPTERNFHRSSTFFV